MRKPRDHDSELATLDAKARELRVRKVAQLGELVIACKADTLSVELLAGVLLAAVATTNTVQREAWRTSGAAFFRGVRNKSGGDAGTPGIPRPDQLVPHRAP